MPNPKLAKDFAALIFGALFTLAFIACNPAAPDVPAPQPAASATQPAAYGGYGCLPVNKYRVGKGGAVNRNDGLHSALRGRLNKLVRRTKGYSKTDGILTPSLALA